MWATNLSVDFRSSKRRARLLTLYRRFHYLANVKPLKAIPLARESKAMKRKGHRSRRSSSSCWSALFKQQSTSLPVSMKICWDLLLSLCRAKYFTEILEEFQECARVAAPTFCLDFWYIIDCVVRSCWLVASVKCTLAGNLAQLSAVYK